MAAHTAFSPICTLLYLEGEPQKMKSIVVRRVAVGLTLLSSLAFASGASAHAGGDNLAALQVDQQFIAAVQKSDRAALDKLLDVDFTWTDATGYTQSRSKVLENIPRPVVPDETPADAKLRTYGDVAAVLASRDKTHVLRVWVKRHSGWRLLVYHEVKQLDQPPTSGGPGVKDCENPCKIVPFHPQNADEQAIIASWQALETGVTTHDAAAWAPHVADDFVQVSSNSDHPIDKAGRIATLNKQKETGVGSAPAPLVSAQMYDFGDAVVMTCLHQPYAGKPIHVSRIWIKRNAQWIMSVSFQTTMQSAPAKAS